MAERVIVIGAGIVGISTALALRQTRRQVLLLDRRQPAQETSAGNAGIIGTSSILPLARPSLLPQLPRLLLNRDSKFRLHYPHLARLTPWLARFLTHCTEARKRHCTRALVNLLSESLQAHKIWIRQTDTGHLLRDTGWLRLYNNAQHPAIDEEAADYARFDIPCEKLDAGQIQALEPDLQVEYPAALWLKEVQTVSDPQAIAQAYFQHFLSLGGEFEAVTVTSLKSATDGWEVCTDERTYPAAQVVVALGPWSPRLLKPLGLPNPIIWERGYHAMLPPPQQRTLSRALADVDRGYVITPMRDGLRVTTGTELVAGEAPPNPAQLHQVLPEAARLLDCAPPEQPYWMGRRPSTFDSLPVTGPAPGLAGLWLNYGHGHLGFTLGPVTGRLIAEAMEHDRWPTLHTACLPSRFSGSRHAA